MVPKLLQSLLLTLGAGLLAAVLVSCRRDDKRSGLAEPLKNEWLAFRRSGEPTAWIESLQGEVLLTPSGGDREGQHLKLDIRDQFRPLFPGDRLSVGKGDSWVKLSIEPAGERFEVKMGTEWVAPQGRRPENSHDFHEATVVLGASRSAEGLLIVPGVPGDSGGTAYVRPGRFAIRWNAPESSAPSSSNASVFVFAPPDAAKPIYQSKVDIYAGVHGSEALKVALAKVQLADKAVPVRYGIEFGGDRDEQDVLLISRQRDRKCDRLLMPEGDESSIYELMQRLATLRNFGLFGEALTETYAAWETHPDSRALRFLAMSVARVSGDRALEKALDQYRSVMIEELNSSAGEARTRLAVGELAAQIPHMAASPQGSMEFFFLRRDIARRVLAAGSASDGLLAYTQGLAALNLGLGMEQIESAAQLRKRFLESAQGFRTWRSFSEAGDPISTFLGSAVSGEADRSLEKDLDQSGQPSKGLMPILPGDFEIAAEAFAAGYSVDHDKRLKELTRITERATPGTTGKVTAVSCLLVRLIEAGDTASILRIADQTLIETKSSRYDPVVEGVLHLTVAYAMQKLDRGRDPKVAEAARRHLEQAASLGVEPSLTHSTDLEQLKKRIASIGAPSALRPLEPLPDSYGDRRNKDVVLTFGIDSYGHDWPKITNARADASRVYHEFRDRYGFQGKDLPNVSAKQFMLQLRRSLDELDSGEQLVVYIAGHGGIAGGTSYIAFAGAERPLKKWGQSANLLSVTTIIEEMARRKRGTTVLFTDTCYGGIADGTLDRMTERGGKGSAELPYFESIEYALASPSCTFICSGIGKVPDGVAGASSPFNRVLVNALSQDTKKRFLLLRDIVAALRVAVGRGDLEADPVVGTYGGEKGTLVLLVQDSPSK